MPQSLANNLLHLVFSTKNREPYLRRDLRPELHAYMAVVLANINCPVLMMNSVADHVHLLFSLHRTVALSSAVEEVKKSSSKWLKTKSPDLANFAWQGGYGAFSVSQSNIAAVKRYIGRQEEHHRTVTFKDELTAFFRKNGVAFDERYLWD